MHHQLRYVVILIWFLNSREKSYFVTRFKRSWGKMVFSQVSAHHSFWGWDSHVNISHDALGHGYPSVYQMCGLSLSSPFISDGEPTPSPRYETRHLQPSTKKKSYLTPRYQTFDLSIPGYKTWDLPTHTPSPPHYWHLVVITGETC